MSAISDNQKRTICRAVFLLLCFVPTLVTIYQICHPHSPEEWARSIQAELGIETEIGAIESPGPYEVILRDLRFVDGDQTLFQTVEARIVYGAVNRVIIDYPVSGLDSVGLAHLASRINQHVLCKNRCLEKIWRIEFKDQMVIHKPNSDRPEPAIEADQLTNEFFKFRNNRLTLARNTRIDLVPTSDGTSLTAYFKVRKFTTTKQEPSPELFSETMMFDIKTLPEAQIVQLNTHEGELPVWLLDGVRPELAESLGSRATFQGSLEIIPNQFQVEHLSGIFAQVDISHYPNVGDPSELAMIKIRECKFGEGKFQKWYALLSSPSVAPTQIYERHLFQQSKQLAFYTALEEAIRVGRQYR